MSQTRHTDSWIAFHVFHMWCFRVGLIFLQTLVKFLDVHQPQAGTIWLQRSSGGWKSLNAYLIRCLRRDWALKQISGVFFRLETRLLDAATDPFGFFFLQLFLRMFFGRGLLSIYNAAMHSPCTAADDFDHQLAAGQKMWTCWLSVSDFSLVWMAIYWPRMRSAT